MIFIYFIPIYLPAACRPAMFIILSRREIEYVFYRFGNRILAVKPSHEVMHIIICNLYVTRIYKIIVPVICILVFCSDTSSLSFLSLNSCCAPRQFGRCLSCPLSVQHRIIYMSRLHTGHK